MIFANLLFLLIGVQLAVAKVQVAFIEIKSPSGIPIQLAPGEKFAHAAISFQEGWLHAHPSKGVEVIPSAQLQKLGHVTLVTLEEVPDLTNQEIDSYLGKPYDFDYTWLEGSYYCSELVAKLLGLSPTPMTFSGAHWAKRFQDRRGELGLSPDEVYRLLTQFHFLQSPRCSQQILMTKAQKSDVRDRGP